MKGEEVEKGEGMKGKCDRSGVLKGGGVVMEGGSGEGRKSGAGYVYVVREEKGVRYRSG